MSVSVNTHVADSNLTAEVGLADESAMGVESVSKGERIRQRGGVKKGDAASARLGIAYGGGLNTKPISSGSGHTVPPAKSARSAKLDAQIAAFAGGTASPTAAHAADLQALENLLEGADARARETRLAAEERNDRADAEAARVVAAALAADTAARARAEAERAEAAAAMRPSIPPNAQPHHFLTV